MKKYLIALTMVGLALSGCSGSKVDPLSDIAATEDVVKEPVAQQNINSGTFAVGDINKDGVVDAEDFGYFKQIYDRYPNGCAHMDANCDGIVDSEDLKVWQETYGEKRYKLGDLDSDGDVDEADFEKYKKNPDLLQ